MSRQRMKSIPCLSPLLGLLLCSPVLGDTLPPQASTAAAPAQVHSCKEIKAFKLQLHEAITAALKYPHELALHPLTGVTYVAYDYLDGHVSNAHITMYSGDGTLDRIAVAAVEDADYASITPQLDGEKIHDLVIVVFDNTGESEHSSAAKSAKKKQAAADANCGD
jgi:hypothetical protein